MKENTTSTTDFNLELITGIYPSSHEKILSNIGQLPIDARITKIGFENRHNSNNPKNK